MVENAEILKLGQKALKVEQMNEDFLFCNSCLPTPYPLGALCS